MTKDKLLKLQCVSCGRETNHKKEWEKKIEWSNEDVGIWGNTIYQAFSCLGCEEITFRTVSTNSEDMVQVGEDQYELQEDINYYTKRNIRMIKEKIDVYNAPPKVRRIYRETIEAFNNEQLILCAIGIRAIIEAICLAENITVEGLGNKINALIKNGVITPKLGEGLQENRLLGNQSAHELETFGDMELLAAIQLIENVIDAHYSVIEKINLLKSRRLRQKRELNK